MGDYEQVSGFEFVTKLRKSTDLRIMWRLKKADREDPMKKTWRMTASAAAEQGLCRETEDLAELKLRESEALAILCNPIFKKEDWEDEEDIRERLEGANGEFWQLSPEAEALLVSLGLNDPEKVDFLKIDSSHPLFHLGQTEGWDKVFCQEGFSRVVVYDTRCLLAEEVGDFSEYLDDYVWHLEVSPIVNESEILDLVEKGDSKGLMDYLHQRGL